MSLKLMLMAFSIFASEAFAIHELRQEQVLFHHQDQLQEIQSTTATSLKTEINSPSEAYWNDNVKTYEFTSKVDGRRIVYFKTEKKRKNVLIISPGRTESSVKYAQLIYYFQNQNFDVVSIEHRGQGFSPRLLPDNDKGYVKEFTDYVSDFSQLVEIVDEQLSVDGNIYILGHSMGGLITTRYLQSENVSQKIKSVVLSSPMFEINSKRVAQFLLEKLTFGPAEDYFYFAEHYAPKQFNIQTEKNTKDEARYNYILKLETEVFPKIKLGGVTNNWIRESLKTGKKALSKTEMEKIKVPILLIVPSNDPTVSTTASKQFCKLLNGICTIFQIDRDSHELFQESKEIRAQVFERLKEAITNR